MPSLAVLHLTHMTGLAIMKLITLPLIQHCKKVDLMQCMQ